MEAPKFLVKTKREKTADLIRDIGAERHEVSFGVGWDKPTIQVLNAIVMDVLAFRRLLKPNEDLLLVCQEGASFLKRVSSSIGVRLSDKPADVKSCLTWKLYWVERCPPVPPSASDCYEKRVSTNERKVLVLKRDEARYPSLFNPSDNHVVPPGLSPNINKIPPRHGNGYVSGPVLF